MLNLYLQIEGIFRAYEQESVDHGKILYRLFKIAYCLPAADCYVKTLFLDSCCQFGGIKTIRQEQKQFSPDKKESFPAILQIM